MTALAWALVLVACWAFEVPLYKELVALMLLVGSTIVEWFKHE